MPNPFSTAVSFRVALDPTDGILSAHWEQSATDSLPPGHYPNLLTAASHHTQCRFWLLDLRNRPWPSSGPGPWLSDTLAVRTFCAPGQAVFVAYVLKPDHRARAERAAISTARRAGHSYDVHPRCFDSEEAARAWLLQQQDLVVSVRQAA